VLFISNGLGNDPHNPSIGRVLSEADLKTARIADERIAEAFAQLDVGTVEEFRALRDDLQWIHDCRKTLAGLWQKLFWLVVSFVAVGLLGFCAQTTLDGIKKGLIHEAREHPTR
jgi:hypothetical protein